MSLFSKNRKKKRVQEEINRRRWDASSQSMIIALEEIRSMTKEELEHYFKLMVECNWNKRVNDE